MRSAGGQSSCDIPCTSVWLQAIRRVASSAALIAAAGAIQGVAQERAAVAGPAITLPDSNQLSVGALRILARMETARASDLIISRFFERHLGRWKR